MTHYELMTYGKRCFRFDEDEDFASVDELLKAAKDSCDWETFALRCSYFLEYLAYYADHHRV